MSLLELDLRKPLTRRSVASVVAPSIEAILRANGTLWMEGPLLGYLVKCETEWPLFDLGRISNDLVGLIAGSNRKADKQGYRLVFDYLDLITARPIALNTQHLMVQIRHGGFLVLVSFCLTKVFHQSWSYYYALTTHD